MRRLTAYPAIVVEREALDALEDRLGVQVSLRDNIRLCPACQPFIMPVRYKGVLVGQRTYTSHRPDSTGPGADYHQVITGLRRQNGVSVLFGLALEELLAYNRYHFDVDPFLFQAR